MDEMLLSKGFAVKGDVVVMVAGIPLPRKGKANFIKAHVVGEV
jgi:pyruvate kinase